MGGDIEMGGGIGRKDCTFKDCTFKGKARYYIQLSGFT